MQILLFLSYSAIPDLTVYFVKLLCHLQAVSFSDVQTTPLLTVSISKFCQFFLTRLLHLPYLWAILFFLYYPIDR